MYIARGGGEEREREQGEENDLNANDRGHLIFTAAVGARGYKFGTSTRARMRITGRAADGIMQITRRRTRPGNVRNTLCIYARLSAAGTGKIPAPEYEYQFLYYVKVLDDAQPCELLRAVVRFCFDVFTGCSLCACARG